jgi:hypothetical protein
MESARRCPSGADYNRSNTWAADARQMLAAARRALGKEWKPTGGTAEGDVLQQLHTDATPLSRFWQGWDGSEDPGTAFAALDAHLRDACGAARR